MRHNTLLLESDSTDLQEQTPTVPRLFYTKFFKQLNNFQKFVQKEYKRKIKQDVEIEQLKQTQRRQRLQSKLIEQQIIRNGNRIKGAWKNNQLHGDVTIYYQDGAFFQGQYENGVRINGIFKFIDGHEYQGGFLCDQFNGEGVLKYPNGKTISGEWCQGLLQGNVTINYPNGDVYYGTVQNYKKHGMGYMFFANGGKYIGNFQNGDITGVGQYLQNQVVIYDGYWEKGKYIRQIEKDPMDETY